MNISKSDIEEFLSTATINDYDVVTTKKGIDATNVKVFQPNPDGTNKPGEVIYDYHVHSPFFASFGKNVSKKIDLFLSFM